MRLVPTGKSFLLFQKFIQGLGILSVHLNLLELRKLSAIVQLAETVYALVGARSLLAELVAREVQNLETLRMIFLVKLLQLGVGGSEAALCGGVNYQQHFVGILLERHLIAFPVFYSEIINCFHLLYFIYIMI